MQIRMEKNLNHEDHLDRNLDSDPKHHTKYK